MLLVLMGYLLLCLPVSLRVDACLCEEGAFVHVFAHVLGVGVRRDGRILLGRQGMRVKWMHAAGKRREKRGKRRAAGKFLRAMARSSRSGDIGAEAILGLDDAAQTALASGALQALLSSAGAAWLGAEHIRVRVIPSYDRPALFATAGGIFAAAPGDIMAALIRAACGNTARSKTGKKGYIWRSIPSRA